MQRQAINRSGRLAIAAWLAVACVSHHTSLAQSLAKTSHTKSKSEFETTYPNATPLAKTIGRAADTAVTDLMTAQPQADAAFQLACTYGSNQEMEAFRESDFAKRLIHQLADAPDSTRTDLLAYLREHSALAHTLVFAVHDGDDVAGIYSLLDRLRNERPAQLDHFPELATALCLVRSHKHLGWTERGVTVTDPIDVFDFYVNHERQMFYGLRGVPVELLIYVVDNTATISDMNWAVNKYAGTRDVGALFFTIAYDYDFYYGKAEQKLVTVPGGYTLPNILKVGGICADQAYFATTVGKSIGIPSAWTTGESALSGHAWVGYLKAGAHSASWDFDSGRYEDYQVVRGNVTDPQTGQDVADSTVGLLSDLIGTNPTFRQNAVAMIDAATLWAGVDTKADPPPFPAELLPPTGKGKAAAKPPAPRAVSPEAELELIEMGLRQFADYPRGWAMIADLARDGKLTESQKKRWADLTQRMCGQKHVDFALSILEPMVETVADANEQSGLWDAIFKFVQARSDLAADVRMRQAKLWEKQNNLPRAGQCYEDVLQHYINAGPFALPALQGAESVLKQMGHEDRILNLYTQAAKLVTKPEMLSGRPEYIRESNWYKVREGYASRLEDAGQKDLAEQIRAENKKG